MKTYEEIVNGYRKRQYNTVVDSISTCLTYVDEVAVESGLLEETGILTDLTSSVCGALPFVIIAATEGTRIILGRKPGKTGLKDGAYRMAKTGAALGVGAAVVATAGVLPAIPVTMGVRALFDRFKLKSMTNRRVQSRIARLRELNKQLREEEPPKEEARLEPVCECLPDGSVQALLS